MTWCNGESDWDGRKLTHTIEHEYVLFCFIMQEADVMNRLRHQVFSVVSIVANQNYFKHFHKIFSPNDNQSSKLDEKNQ